jgi:predicted amidophosphoribosyltransferase
MFCTKCGKKVDDDAIFCSNCGNRVAQDKNDDKIPNPTGYNENPNKEKIRIISNKAPVFRIKCEYCTCEFEYTLSNLGYRPWYPKGFVYCPSCKRPLRHHTENQINN